MKYFTLALLAFPLACLATGTPPPPSPTTSQEQAQGQAQEQAQTQSVVLSSKVGASSEANNEGVTQSVDLEDRKQAPSLGQGSVFIPECGAGGNAGGSGSGGAGFLGFAYVPAWCQDFKYAAWLVSVGDFELACQVMANSKVGKRAEKRGLRAPKCAPPAADPEPKPTVVVITGESCGMSSERADRVLEKCVSK